MRSRAPGRIGITRLTPVCTMQPPVQKCQYFVKRKSRYCKFDAIPGQQFCGNHFKCDASQEGPKRVVCPFDPNGGHTVLETELEKHKLKCPAIKLMLADKAQPFYREGVNEGTGAEGLADLPAEAPAQFADRKGRRDTDAARRAAYAATLGREGFARLLAKVDQAYMQLCSAPGEVSVLVPAEAEPYMTGEDSSRPFSLKHATQQASIVGNMQRAGLMEGAAATTYVEFGAGKGYLSSMVADCSGARKLVMMDLRGFREKADRNMRHLEIQRVRCDIKDFDAARLPGLGGGAAPWVAIGKHLCGAAIDFTLRCCARERPARAGAGAGAGVAAAAAAGTAAAAAQQQQQQEEEEGVSVKPAAAAATEVPGGSEGPQPGAEALPPAAEAAAGGGAAGRRGLQGLAVATCCHHRCSWRHYVGQPVFLEAGFSPREFEVVSWMTGWALCGHEAPAGFGGADGDCGDGGAASGSDGEEDGRVGKGRRPAPALVAAAAAGEQGGTDSRRQVGAAPEGGGAGAEGWGEAAAEGQGPAKRQHVEPAGMQHGAAPPGPQQHSVAAGEGGAGAGEGVVWQEELGSWRPYHSLSRPERIAVGQKCKRLIDVGRLLWLQQQGFQASLVAYVPPEVSGENQLLLATTTVD